MVRQDLKNKIKSNLLSFRDCAQYLGVPYNTLMSMLNGFCSIRPEVEKKINEFIQLKGQAIIPGSKITGRPVM